MGYIQILLMLTIGMITALAQESSETPQNKIPLSTVNEQPVEQTTEVVKNATTRRGRGLMVDRIELPAAGTKIRTQVIKIPPNVSKVKLVRPSITVRSPQRIKRFPLGYNNGGQRRPNNKKQQIDDDKKFDIDDSLYFNTRKFKKNQKWPKVKEVSPQEFYNSENEYEYEASNLSPKVMSNIRFQVETNKGKNNEKNFLKEYLINHEMEGRYDRTNYPNVGYGSYKVGQVDTEQPLQGYDAAATSIRMKQVPAPNLVSMKVINSQETMKQYPVERTVLGKLQDDNYIPGLSVKKLPLKGRQIQSIFSQQYTTHNPHVATNLGLSGLGEYNDYRFVPKGSYVDASPFTYSTALAKISESTMAASEQVATALPALTTGIQVIQPPQFRDVTVSHPSYPSRVMNSIQKQQEESSSQRATIRDILEQDCVSHETKGYCESPPRYPTQQINNIIKKCSNLMEVMTTPAFEEPQEVFEFARRSDTDVDTNKTFSPTDLERASQWSRSDGDGNTACHSELTVIEPGYAKEVNSGRWFVIVQNSDNVMQRITTESCRNPGKPCGGLAGLKCSKINGLPNKSTRCIQRFMYQRLVSWDPEAPDSCPRIRMFRFPSACVCHLGVV